MRMKPVYGLAATLWLVLAMCVFAGLADCTASDAAQGEKGSSGAKAPEWFLIYAVVDAEHDSCVLGPCAVRYDSFPEEVRVHRSEVGAASRFTVPSANEEKWSWNAGLDFLRRRNGDMTIHVSLIDHVGPEYRTQVDLASPAGSGCQAVRSMPEMGKKRYFVVAAIRQIGDSGLNINGTPLR